MRRSTPVELRGIELHELSHVRRRLARERARVRHAIVAPLPGKLGRGQEISTFAGLVMHASTTANACH